MTAVAKKQRSRPAVAKAVEPPRTAVVARNGRGGSRPASSTADLVLGWYDSQRRDLPWRSAPGTLADPYRVWLSEIMLQQTTVKAVIPYFDRFLARFPTVGALAAADLEEVLQLWAGLGYYSRAGNLHACAQAIASRHHGRFPADAAALLELPGIGPYTAAAIAAIAFGLPTTPVDGNVERVVARLHAVEAPLPAAKPELRRLAATLTPAARSGDFAQAMMDLGATICTPRRPSCLMCPLHGGCKAYARGIQGALPRKLERAARPVRFGTAFLALREDGHVLLRERPATGLLARMLEVPSTAWGDHPPVEREAVRAAPLNGDWWAVPGGITHVFTHFRLELTVVRAVVPVETSLNLWAEPDRCRWVARRQLHAQALPSVMRKLIAHGMRES